MALQRLVLWIWIIFVKDICLSTKTTTVTTTKSEVTTPDNTAPAEDHTTQSPQTHDINLHLSKKKTINVAAIASSTQNNRSFAVINIHIRPHISHDQDYYSHTCSLQSDTLHNLCLNEINALDKSLAIIASLTDNLQHYQNIICPSSVEWLSFINCYCTKCESELSNIPNKDQWYTIWKKTGFCEVDQFENNMNLCQTLVMSASKSRSTGQIDIDSAFKKAWNDEIHSEITISEIITRKTRLSAEKIPSKFEEIDHTPKEDLEIYDRSVSSMFTTHPFIYIWTMIFASCVTLLSFFIFYR